MARQVVQVCCGKAAIAPETVPRCRCTTAVEILGCDQCRMWQFSRRRRRQNKRRLKCNAACLLNLAQRCPRVHLSKSNPTQSTSLLTQSDPIHYNCEYFDPHPIQSSVHSIGENIIRYVSEFDFIYAVNAAC